MRLSRKEKDAQACETSSNLKNSIDYFQTASKVLNSRGMKCLSLANKMPVFGYRHF